MANILIEPSKAKQVLGRQDSLEHLLKTLSQDVDSVRSGLRYKIAGQESISQRLREAAEQITKESQSTYALRSCLEEIIALYEQTETGNLDRVATEKSSIQDDGSAGQTDAGNEFQLEEFDWVQLLIDQVANVVGPFGILYTGGKSLLEGDTLGALSDLAGSLGDVVGTAVKISKADWAAGKWVEEFFPLGKITGEKGKLFENFNERLGDEIGDFSSVQKGMGTLISWGGALISSGIDNYKEFEGDFSGRFWGETIVETGINIAKDAAIAAAVGAGIVAAVGSAPVLAVEAATIAAGAVIDWGLNNVVKWATNGEQTDWVEAVSDVVCDTGEKIIDGVGSAVTKTWDGLKEGASGIWNGLFSGCEWGSVAA